MHGIPYKEIKKDMYDSFDPINLCPDANSEDRSWLVFSYGSEFNWLYKNKEMYWYKNKEWYVR